MKTIYCNAKVYSGKLPLAEAFAVEDGRFVFCGSGEDAEKFRNDGDVIVDLGGAFVVPGFIDSHMHVLNYGQALACALLNEHTDSLGGMIEYLKEFSKRGGFSDTSWLTGRGWNQDFFTDEHRLPDRHDLDKVSTEFPIMAVRACGHCLVLNTRALEFCGITADTECPEGGTIGMENGVPNGLLFDNAMNYVYDRIPAPDKDTVKRYICSAMAALNSYGVTSSQSDDLAVFLNLPWQTVDEAYKELEAEGKMTVRVYEQSNFSNLAAFEGFVAAGNVTGKGSDFYKIGPLKMLGDGALGPRTAFLSVPYADDPDAVGLPVFTQKELDDMFDCAVKNHMQIAVHAIGDACLDRVLSAYEKAFNKYQPKDHRCGIVHCQITRPDQLEKIAELGLIVYAQSIFLDYDIRIVEPRVGKELASSSYSWKTLMNKGVSVSNGTDCPVELPNAIGGIQCAVTRKTLSGEGPYLPDQAFSVEEALASYTKAGAYASFEENTKGQIKPGMLADFTVLGSSLFEIAPEEIKNTKVLATYVGGKKVFGE